PGGSPVRSGHNRRQSQRERSFVIDGHPRIALIGSSNRTKESQMIGANHVEGYRIGTIAPKAPLIARLVSIAFDMLMVLLSAVRLKISKRNSSAVIKSNGKIVAKAQS